MAEDDFIDGGSDARQAELFDQQKNAVAEGTSRLRLAYARVFSAGDTTQDDIDIVMQDLVRFGRVLDTTVVPAGRPEVWPRDVLEGRRQMALRILEYARLDFDSLMRRYHGSR
jgi:hypothetical protein